MIFRHRLILAALLFALSSTIPIVARAISPPAIVQAQNGQSLTSQAKQAFLQSDWQTAATLWQQAATQFANRGDRLNQAMALSNLSLSYQQLGQWESARTAINESLALLKTQPNRSDQQRILAQTLDIQGQLQRETGQFSEALTSWQQASQLYDRLKDPSKAAQSRLNQVQAMQDLGLTARACKTVFAALPPIQLPGAKTDPLKTAQTCQDLGLLSNEQFSAQLATIEQNAPSVSTAIALRSLSDLLRSIGQPEPAKLALNTSLNVSKKSNSMQDQADAYLSLGNIEQTLASGGVRLEREKAQTRALAAYTEAAKLATSPLVRLQAQVNQLSFLIQTERTNEAIALWQTLKPELAQIPSSHTGLYLQLNLPQNLSDLARKGKYAFPAQLPSFADLEQMVDRAIDQAKKVGDQRAYAYALGIRGGLYELAGAKQNLTQAEALTRQALQTATTFEVPDITYQLFWQLGRIHTAQKNLPSAIAAYTKSYNALQSLRGDLVAINPEVQFSFRESVEPVYRELVRLDVQYAKALQDKGNEKESQAVLVQARDVIESLQLAQLNNFFREACVEAKTEQIDAIDPKAAVIYPIILPDQLAVLLSLPKQPPRLYTQPVKKDDLENTIEAVYRSLLDPQSDLKTANQQYEQLYNWIIAPLQPELERQKDQFTTLAFVLDGSLRGIPMAALHDSKRNQYLIEQYAIALTPGLRLVEPKAIAQVELKALTAGLSKLRPDLPDHQGFAPLTNVDQELNQIEKVGLTRRSLENQTFTSGELGKQIGDVQLPIVHLATHAQFGERAEDTFILAWDRRINVKQLSTLLQSNLNARQSIELLVLSACQTATGNDREVLGLAGVAVRAGARSTLATLWSVADPSTAKVMGDFYRELSAAKKNNINKAQALQRAQRELMQTKEYNHPHFWAPYVLVGNWQ